jgi:predicted solute-binding protein
VYEDLLELVPDIVTDLIAAKLEGIDNIEKIASRYSAEIDLPLSDLLYYLRENVNYDLDEENLAGLRRYFLLAEECGLIPQARELQFA